MKLRVPVEGWWRATSSTAGASSAGTSFTAAASAMPTISGAWRSARPSVWTQVGPGWTFVLFFPVKSDSQAARTAWLYSKLQIKSGWVYCVLQMWILLRCRHLMGNWRKKSRSGHERVHKSVAWHFIVSFSNSAQTEIITFLGFDLKASYNLHNSGFTDSRGAADHSWCTTNENSFQPRRQKSK